MESMLRFKVGLVVLALATSACSYKHAGKGMVGGLVLATAGMYIFNATKEAEGDTTAPQVGLAMVPVGLLIAVMGLVGAANGPPPEAPLAPPPLPEKPKLPPVVGSDELRSHKRVAQYMAEHGKCEQVLQISVRVAAADAKFYAASFASDETIARCLPPQR
jgi:hypothetical protein